jgi:hypothetical protein
MGFLDRIGGALSGRGNTNSHVSSSPYDQIRREDEEGEHWHSDEFAPSVGYRSQDAQRNLRRVIESVIESYGYGTQDVRIVADVGDNSQVKSRGRKAIVYRMSRKFLMSLAHKLDIRKEEVRLLHTYLDIQVRRSELSDQQKAEARISRTERAAKKFGHSFGWCPVRNQNKSYNAEIIAAVLERIGGDMFSAVYDTIHVGVTGKHAPQLRAAMGLKKGSPFDGYDSQCLIIVSSVAVSLLALFDAGDLNRKNVVEETERLVRLHKASQLEASRHDAIGKKQSGTGHVIFGAIRTSIASS